MLSDCEISEACLCCIYKANKEIQQENYTLLYQQAIVRQLYVDLAAYSARSADLAYQILLSHLQLKEKAVYEQQLACTAYRLSYFDELQNIVYNTQRQTASHRQDLAVRKDLIKAISYEIERMRTMEIDKEEEDLYAEVSLVMSDGSSIGNEYEQYYASKAFEVDLNNRRRSNSHVVVGSLVRYESLCKSQHTIARRFSKYEILRELSIADEFTTSRVLHEYEDSIQRAVIEKILYNESDVCMSPEKLRRILLKHKIHTIPFSLREQLWPVLIGNPLFVTKALYEQTVTNIEFQLDRLTAKTIGTACLNVECDLTRTYPHIPLFQYNSALTSNLRELLQALSLYCRCGYVQGLAYPASLVLLVMDKYKAFRCLANLFMSEFLNQLLTFDQEDYRLKNRIFEHLLKKHLPNLWKHLQRSGASPEVLLVEWFFSMFCRAFRLEVVMKVWDRLLIDGEPAYYSFALAILKLCERNVLQAEPTASYALIKTQSRYLSFEQLMECTQKLNFTRTIYHKTISELLGH